MKANLHSIETLGLFDGPGIRTVLFFKGCPLRCKYCHNPDTQTLEGGQSYSVEALVEICKKYKSYYKSSGGGVTLSGGEPLMQGAFLVELITGLKAEGIHVALDTSGYGDTRYMKQIVSLVDLVLLDIKHVDTLSHKRLVGISMNGLHDFIKLLSLAPVKVWVRHVMVPTMTDSKEIMLKLYNLTKTFIDLVEKFEILPYHKLGIEKYSQLDKAYTLSHLPEMNALVAKEFEDVLNEKLRLDRTEKSKLNKCVI